MIVFRDHNTTCRTDTYLKRIKSEVQISQHAKVMQYRDMLSLLIDAAELETGITDFYYNKNDDLIPEIDNFQQITLNAGQIVCDCHQKRKTFEPHLKKIVSLVSEISTKPFPQFIPQHQFEGYRYYGLYPDTYIEAADHFYKERHPESVVCIGLRSIGTSLAAVVSAKLKQCGCNVFTITVRPVGHPFNRTVKLSDRLKQILIEKNDHWFLIIDEGPGLSGSSITGTLQTIAELGISVKRTVIFPSWIPDGSGFVSKKASSLWPLYLKYTGSFENQWINNKRLEKILNKRIIADLSAGMWRQFLYNNNGQYPAAHPHHERRKYMLCDPTDQNAVSPTSLAKFTGLGKYGEELYNRADTISRAGFAPAVIQCSYGFTIMDYIDGKPCTLNHVNDTLLDFASKYFTFLKNKFPGTTVPDFEKMIDMIIQNCMESAGIDDYSLFTKISKFPPSLYNDGAVQIDGRCMPHEWVLSNDKFYKTDFIEHHADQFFPQCQNIAWDIAGFCIEFQLDESIKNRFVNICSERLNDLWLEVRLPFYSIAYCAFRLGYSSMACSSAIDDAEKNRFQIQTDLYRHFLSIELKKFHLP